MKKIHLQYIMGAISLIFSLPIAFAQPSLIATATVDTRIQELGWLDKNHMERKVSKISEFALAKIGTPIQGDFRDLHTLQQLLEKNVVAQEDYETQQAMGIALGNVMQADFPTTLEWKIYEDNLGRSRALCVKGTNQCLFPITMLSRRMELGIKPDVEKIYNDSILLMEKYLPHLPYGGGIYYRLPRR